MAVTKKITPTSLKITSGNIKSFIGRRLKVVLNTGYPGAYVGETPKLLNVTNIGTGSAHFHLEGVNSGLALSFNYSTFEGIAETRDELMQQKEEIRKAQKELDKEIAISDAKLAYLLETNENEVDEKTFRIYQAMKTIEKDMSPHDKAKLLSQIL